MFGKLVLFVSTNGEILCDKLILLSDPINTVSTTFAITIVATTAATLTPILNRILKPAFKKFIGTAKKAVGKKGTKFTGKKPLKSKLNS